MQRLWMIAATLAVSCVLAGCDSDGGSVTVTPEEKKSAYDEVANKWAEHKGPMFKGKSAPASTPAKTK